VYVVTTLGTGANGTWTRSGDTDVTGELLAGTIIMVTEGLIYADTQWKLITDNPIDIGTTPLIFTQNYLANVIQAGNSNVTVYSNANIAISSAGVANVLLVTDAGTYVDNFLSVNGNIYANSNIVTGGPSGNIFGANVISAVTFSASGNIYAKNINLNGNLIPVANSVYTLGDATHWWKSAYFGANTLYIGGNALGAAPDGTLQWSNANVVVSNTPAGEISQTGNITGGNLISTGQISGNNISVVGNVTLGNRLDWVSNGNSVVYQVYNAGTGSLDTIFG
jgi:hypothetical protein